MKLITTLRTARSQLIIDAAGTNPKFKYYDGTESFTPAGTLLATLNITGALGSVTSGVTDINETVTQNKASHVSGTPTFALVTTSADVVVGTLAIPEDMTVTGGVITTDVDLAITTGATITEGNA